MVGILRIPAECRHALGGVRFLCRGDRPELPFVVGDGLLEHGEQVLCMRRRDGDDGLCPRLVDLRELVEEHERELVILVRDLDHVAVDGVKRRGDIDGYFLSGHTDLFSRFWYE